MTLVDLLDIVPDAYDELKCSAYECDICIDLGNDYYRIVDKVQLLFNDDKSHAILVFGCRS